MAGTLEVGLAQRVPLPIEAPVADFATDVERTLAEHPQITLLVYPELHLCGTEHLPTAARADALESHAHRLDSPFVAELGVIARAHGIWLCPGSIGERGPDGEFFNTQLLFDPSGTLRASYRKMFPWRPFEPHRPGTEFVIADLDGAGTAGFSICYDAWFPEHSRQLAWLGADLVLNIVKTTTPDREQELVLARANAIVNQNLVASVNCAAPVGRGRSIVVGPEGFVIAEAGVGEQTLTFAFDPEGIARVRAHGTMGSNRMWAQFRDDDDEIPLPMYDGRIDPRTWAAPHP
ncbi:carbon-nitrogen hydrolase family protein [Microbacterium sp. W4I20]|uniref:carbon-nitrogen hydrolase family protein n=1 Tax=Microbacterium sp. W4I20 TaxID=3042262 RepID=UPI0027847C08|nr:carbon-nitrogen hydrolase family protein [Microbacterium sp. W4I20]MDQ0726504.1 putative amidohydrolase [Microbacterium sp. W4I20]